MTAAIRRAVTADHSGVSELLRAAELPLDGLSAALEHFLVAEDGGRIVAAAGIEVYGDLVLLRSVVVAPSHRGSGVGSRIADAALGLARALGMRDAYLLTDTAADFFRRRGFAAIDRQDVPAGIRASVEFAIACPASAVVMHRRLRGA